ncbi:hypothetical protein DRQ36_03155 [bacterium]|nr:MAG: hypothetical protein DRQ36_03155 [bacterium]
MAFDGTGYGGEYIFIKAAEGHEALIARFEVTNLEFSAFVESGGYETEQYWIVDDGSISKPDLGWFYQGKFGWLCPAGWKNFDNPPWKSDTISMGAFYPVVGVSWWECRAYCKWAGVRLPTEREWAEAAETATEKSEILATKGNFSGGNDGFDNLAPSGCYPTENFADIAGNVWEWLDDVRDVIEYLRFTCAARALAGGSWQSPPDAFPNFRRSECPLLRNNEIGFRLAR